MVYEWCIYIYIHDALFEEVLCGIFMFQDETTKSGCLGFHVGTILFYPTLVNLFKQLCGALKPSHGLKRSRLATKNCCGGLRET